MKIKLQEKLFKKYPKIFGQKDLPMDQTCMCWGIDCGDGWYWLIDNLCDTIQKYVDSRNEGVRIRNKGKKESICIKCGKSKDESCHTKYGADLDNPLKHEFVAQELEQEWQVEATQVKEKFGGLRFYINGADDEVYGMISFAEHLSYKICEDCGSTKNVSQTKGWIRNLCSKCMKEYKKKYEKIKSL